MGVWLLTSSGRGVNLWFHHNDALVKSEIWLKVSSQPTVHSHSFTDLLTQPSSATTGSMLDMHSCASSLTRLIFTIEVASKSLNHPQFKDPYHATFLNLTTLLAVLLLVAKLKLDILALTHALAVAACLVQLVNRYVSASLACLSRNSFTNTRARRLSK